MPAIFTRANSDGTFNEVGMNTRTVCHYKQPWRRDQALRDFAKGKTTRVEVFADIHQAEPCFVYYFNPEA